MNRAEHLLVILGEEACEVAQEASKCLRFGPHEVYAEIGISNAERVMVELADLLALVEMLQKEGVLPEIAPTRASAMVAAKKAKVEHHIAYSKKCGTVSEQKVTREPK